MPKFPHSGYSANQSSGVLVKAQGSPSPSLDLDSPVGDAPQFRVTASRHDEKWWLSVTPGFVIRSTTGTSGLIASDRTILSGDQTVTSDARFGNGVYFKAEKVNCYKSLRYPSAGNDLTLGQQYEADPGSGSKVLVALVCPNPGTDVRLVVIGEDDFIDTFNFYNANGGPGSADFGCSAVIQARTGAELTVTKDVNGKVTDVAISSATASYWERAGLAVRIIARLDTTTGEVEQVSEGPQHFDVVSETYVVEVPYDDVATPPTIIDGNWSAAYYVTGDSNAPSGYTFDY